MEPGQIVFFGLLGGMLGVAVIAAIGGIVSLLAERRAKREKEKREKERIARLSSIPSDPTAILRPLKNPIYDTARTTAGIPDDIEMFTVAVGQDGKSYAETNMLMSGELPRPYEFDLWAFRVESDPGNSAKDWWTYRYATYFEWNFGGGKTWFRVPFSYIPCTKDEEMKVFASALVCEGDLQALHAKRWEEVKDRTKPSREDLAALKEKPIAGEFERRRDFTVRKNPIRIRSNERFNVRLIPDKLMWEHLGLSLERPVGIRVYMEGIAFNPL